MDPAYCTILFRYLLSFLPAHENAADDPHAMNFSDVPGSLLETPARSVEILPLSIRSVFCPMDLNMDDETGRRSTASEYQLWTRIQRRALRVQMK